MRKMSIVVMALCVIGLSACVTATAGSTVNGNVNQTQSISVDVDIALNFRGWYPWGGVRVNPNKNTVTFNGNVNVAGYVNEHLDTALKNKTVSLKIKNAAVSNFSEGRMLKITVNKNDQSVQPLGINLIEGEYIPPECEAVEFILPPDFDGKLGFVFYQAGLKNLQITATYR